MNFPLVILAEDERTLATILAALRYWQDKKDPLQDLLVPNDKYLLIATDSDRFVRLTNEEIDALCERLNA